VTARRQEADDSIDIRQAAVLVGRHPETIRRWVWSGRLAAQRRGKRLFVAPGEVRSVAGQDGALSSLRTWADRARAVRASIGPGAQRESAAILVIEDRLNRSGMARSRARR